MTKLATSLLLICLITLSSNAQKPDKPVGGSCEACDLMFDNMPATMTWQSDFGKSEPGEAMVIEGTIFKKDGKTPAPNVILYVYHTDAKGIYSNAPGEKGNRHGHLRGWMKTDATGKYKFTTIRPAHYPERNAPQHVHPLIKEPGLSLYWIDEYLFDDDPLVTDAVKSREEKRGGNGIIHLTKVNGVWVGKRDIVSGMNIPNY